MQVQVTGRARGRTRAEANAVCRVLLRFVPVLLLLGTLACTPIIRDHGYAPTDPELATLTIGTDSRAEVVEKVGRPSAEGLLNDDQWFFVQSRWEAVGPRAPVEIDRQVVVLSFSDNGTLRNVERFGLEDGRVVTLSRRVTDSSIQSVTLIGQLLGNIGRLRADQLIE